MASHARKRPDSCFAPGKWQLLSAATFLASRAAEILVLPRWATNQDCIQAALAMSGATVPFCSVLVEDAFAAREEVRARGGDCCAEVACSRSGRSVLEWSSQPSFR